MKIKDFPKHLRPREKLIEKGAENLKDSELLAILFRTGNKKRNAIELAQQILEKYPMKKLLTLDYQAMAEIEGIDMGKACAFLAAAELIKRAIDKHDNSLPVINNAQDAVDQLTSIRSRTKEHFVVLFLNARNQLLQKETITIGTLNASLVHPREVFEPAIRLKAAAVILAHNHPSGEVEPSQGDITITKRLVEAGRLLAVELIDHLILTKERYLSMKEEKYF